MRPSSTSRSPTRGTTPSTLDWSTLEQPILPPFTLSGDWVLDVARSPCVQPTILAAVGVTDTHAQSAAANVGINIRLLVIPPNRLQMQQVTTLGTNERLLTLNEWYTEPAQRDPTRADLRFLLSALTATTAVLKCDWPGKGHFIDVRTLEENGTVLRQIITFASDSTHGGNPHSMGSGGSGGPPFHIMGSTTPITTTIERLYRRVNVVKSGEEREALVGERIRGGDDLDQDCM